MCRGTNRLTLACHYKKRSTKAPDLTLERQSMAVDLLRPTEPGKQTAKERPSLTAPHVHSRTTSHSTSSSLLDTGCSHQLCPQPSNERIIPWNHCKPLKWQNSGLRNSLLPLNDRQPANRYSRLHHSNLVEERMRWLPPGNP